MNILDQDQDQTVSRLFEHDHTLLVGEMGAGKTVCALTAMQELMLAGVLGRVLVLAPARVCDTVWAVECEQWDHLNLTVESATGTPKERKAIIAGRADVVCISFEVLPWFFKTYGRKHGFDGLVVDELTRFRSPGGAQAKALRPRLNDFSWRVGMTGTPVSESWEGLYGQMLVVDGGKRLGTNKEKYLLSYFYPTDFEQHNWALRQGMDARLTAKIADAVYVMPSYTHLLPPCDVWQVDVVLPEIVMQGYNKLCKSMVLGDDIEAANAAVLSGKLQQYASGAVYDMDGDPVHMHDIKMHEFDRVYAGVYAPVIIVYQFQFELDWLRETFPDAPVMKEAKKAAPALVDKWNAGEVPVLLMHPRSGGHGLNLAKGGHVQIWLGPVWSRDAWDQTIARLWRRGQTDPVDIFVLVANQTIEKLVVERRDAKGENHGDFIAHIKKAAEKAREAA